MSGDTMAAKSTEGVEDGWEDLLGSGALMKRVLTEGTGGRPVDRQEVTVHVIGRERETKRVYEDTYETNSPLVFMTMDQTTDILPGVLLAVRLMNEGEKSEYRFAPRHAFGEKGSADFDIPPECPVEYVIELVKLGPIEPLPGEMGRQELVDALTKKRERGNVLFKRGDFHRALQSYDLCMAMLKDTEIQHEDLTAAKIHTMNNRAMTLEKLDRLIDAKQACVDVLEIDVGNFKALLRAGTIATQLNDFEEATAALLKAREINDTALVRSKLRELNTKLKNHRMKEREMFGGWASRITPDTEATKSENAPLSKAPAPVPNPDTASTEHTPTPTPAPPPPKEEEEASQDSGSVGGKPAEPQQGQALLPWWVSPLLSLVVAGVCVFYALEMKRQQSLDEDDLSV